MAEVDGLSAYKKPRTNKYYENYDRVFGTDETEDEKTEDEKTEDEE